MRESLQHNRNVIDQVNEQSPAEVLRVLTKFDESATSVHDEKTLDAVLRSSELASRKQLAHQLLVELGMDFEKGAAISSINANGYSTETRILLHENPIALLEIPAAAMHRAMTQDGASRGEAIEVARRIVHEDLPGILPALGSNLTIEHLRVLSDIASTADERWLQSLFRFNLRAATVLHGKTPSPEQLQGYASALLSDYDRLHRDADDYSCQIVARSMHALGAERTPEKLLAHFTEVRRLQDAIRKLGTEAHHLDYWIMPWIGQSNAALLQPMPLNAYSDQLINFAKSLSKISPGVASGGINIVCNHMPNAWRGNFSYEKFCDYLTAADSAIHALHPHEWAAAYIVLPAIMANPQIDPAQFELYAQKLSALSVLDRRKSKNRKSDEGNSDVDKILGEIVPAILRTREQDPMTPEVMSDYVTAMIEIGAATHRERKFADFIKIAGEVLNPQNYTEIANSFGSVAKIAERFRAPYLTSSLYTAVAGRAYRNWDDVEPCTVILEKMRLFACFAEDLKSDDVPAAQGRYSSQDWNNQQRLVTDFERWATQISS